MYVERLLIIFKSDGRELNQLLSAWSVNIGPLVL